MKRVVLAVAPILLTAAAASLHAQELFDLQKVADGVYAAVARPRRPINCSGAYVVYDDSVLVVNTRSPPSSARALVARIKPRHPEAGSPTP